ncbi:MAG: phosphatidylserine decarboxylase [Elusimicrobia bacterium]|nr:phosphatidylserine decarboxylase [Elusimicrobiota bacterium]
MSIVPEGVKLILIGCGIIAISGIVSIWSKWLGVPIFIFAFLFTGFSFYFFRDPERDKSFAPGQIACPADGTVLSVKSEGNPDITVIRIFLSIFNVHLQRSPINGKILDTEFTKGNFAIAYKPEASVNQRKKIRIAADDGKVIEVEQITGSIARRIACYVKKDQKVKAGEKIGMIYFGSQVALYLPSSVNVLVKPGEKVQAGETTIALRKDN